MSKLMYKILPTRRPVEVIGVNGLQPMEAVDVEWSHADGPVTDTHIVPVTHPPNIQYETRVSGTREVIKDQVIVPVGTSTDDIESELIRKRRRIAENLGLAL